MAECAGLENRWARKGPVSSNLTSSVLGSIWQIEFAGGERAEQKYALLRREFNDL